MIAQELSRYPAEYDDDQRRLEQLAQKREAAVGIMGSLAVLTMSGGVLETGTPDQTTSNENYSTLTEKTTRSIGSSALSTIMERDHTQLEAALARQAEMVDYALAA